MKVKVGMKVYGECSHGTVVAMSKEWCIYQAKEKNGDVHEYAEPWFDIMVAHDGPDAVVSSVNESRDVPIAED